MSFRSLILGWHGSDERRLRLLAKHDAARGADVLLHVPRTFRAMSMPGGWSREGRALAQRLARAHAERPLPLVIHAFSNAGFWTLAALLDALEPALHEAHRATILDSAPGIPDRITPFFTARYATRAMLPSLLGALGRTPAHEDPVVGPPFAAFLFAWHLIAPAQVRFMASSRTRIRERHREKPLLVVWGGRDTLVPEEHVESFVRACERDGVPLERLYFPDGDHVRHLVASRRVYLATRDAFIARALAR